MFRTIFLFTGVTDPIFCAITHVLALAFIDDAFEAPSLKTMEQISILEVRDPIRCIHLRWKELMLKTPVFRHAVRVDGKFKTSLNKLLLYATLNYYTNQLGVLTGFEKPLTLYCIRRAVSNSVNGKTPYTAYNSPINATVDSATSAVQDQIMRHETNSNTFNEAYVNERVRFHVQNAFLERPSEDGLLKAFAHMSLTCDP